MIAKQLPELPSLPNDAATRLSSLGVDVESSLGDTDYGHAFRGQDQLGNAVIIKIRECTEEDAEPLLEEIQTIQNLKLPNIESIVHAFWSGSHICVVTAYVAGPALTSVPQTDAAEDIVPIIQKIATCLKTVHDAGVVHGNLNPAQIKLVNDQPVITNFGVYSKNKLTMSEAAQAASSDLAYRAPERIVTDSRPLESEKPIGRWTDVYGLGTVMYFLLTGKPPFSGKGSRLVDKIIYGRPVRPRLFGREIPRSVDAICMKSLSRRIPRRYANAEALLQDLKAYEAGEPVSAVGLRRESVATAIVIATVTTAISAVLVAGIALWASVSPVMEFDGITDFQDLSNATSYSNGY